MSNQNTSDLIEAYLKKILEEKGIESTNGFEVMTIHSLAAKIIKENVFALQFCFNYPSKMSELMRYISF